VDEEPSAVISFHIPDLFHLQRTIRDYLGKRVFDIVSTNLAVHNLFTRYSLK